MAYALISWKGEETFRIVKKRSFPIIGGSNLSWHHQQKEQPLS